MIDLQKVTKQFGNRTVALSEIDLKITEGEFAFLIGSTGSGKTTLLKLLTREYAPTSGKIFVDNEDLNRLKGMSLTRLRRKIGVIFQDFKLLFDRTVFENIALPLEIMGARGKEIKEKVEQTLEIVNLMKQKDLFPAQLSGGEMQRVSIARAVIVEPKIILADEPTGNLDPSTGWDIIKLLRNINKKKMVTVIMASHNVDVVNTLGQRVIRLENGKIKKDEKEGKYGD